MTFSHAEMLMRGALSREARRLPTLASSLTGHSVKQPFLALCFSCERVALGPVFAMPLAGLASAVVSSGRRRARGVHYGLGFPRCAHEDALGHE